MQLPKIIPELRELKNGKRPDEVVFHSENLGGPTLNRRTIVESVFSVDYTKKVLDFKSATHDDGINKIPILSRDIPANHRHAAGRVARVIFEKGRAWVRYVPYESSTSVKTLVLVEYLDEEGEEAKTVFRSREYADLWSRISGFEVVNTHEVTPTEARDFTYENYLDRVLQRKHLNFLPEFKDKRNTVRDLLDILYERDDFDQHISRLRTTITPTAVINFAKENGQEVLYTIGLLMDTIAKAENARSKLRNLNVKPEELKKAWEFMYKDEFPMPTI